MDEPYEGWLRQGLTCPASFFPWEIVFYGQKQEREGKGCLKACPVSQKELGETHRILSANWIFLVGSKTIWHWRVRVAFELANPSAGRLPSS